MLVVSVFLNACTSNSIEPYVYWNTASLIDGQGNIATGRVVFHSVARDGDIKIKNTKLGNLTGKFATQTAELISQSSGNSAVMSSNQTILKPTLTPPPPSTSGPVVGITGDRFTLNGVPTFLLGVSYFDVLGWKASDFDMLAARKFNLIRIWLDWGVWNDRSRSFFDADGNLVRKPELLNIVRAAAMRGIVVDVTILDSGNASGAGNPENAVRNAVQALSGEPNVFFDLVNEHSRDPREWSINHTRMKSLVGIAHAANPKALVTLSADENHYNESGVGVDLGIGLNLLAPHFGRVSGVFRTKEKVAGVKSKTGLPVYLQEENRRGWRGDFSITKDDFLKAAGEAVTAGAAGWVFHTAAGFNLTVSNFFDNLDAVERATVEELGDAVFPVIPALEHIRYYRY